MSHCPCIALNHGHKTGQCDEPPSPQGGICSTCRYALSPKRDVPK